MLKRRALKKIFITTFVLFVVLSIYMIPNKRENNIGITYDYLKTKDVSVFLLNPYNQLTKYNFKVRDSSVVNIVNEVINKLIISKDDTIPSFFMQVIPSSVIVEHINIDDGIASIDFSSSFLDISIDNLEVVVESVVYSLLDLDFINGVSLYVSSENIGNLYPENFPYVFNKEFGINKRYEFTNFSSLSKVIVYYLDMEDDNLYYVPVTKYLNDSRSKIEIIIDELSNRYLYESNLVSLIDSNLKFKSFDIGEDFVCLDFDGNTNFSNFSQVIDSISYSIFANFDVSSVFFDINGQKIEKKVKKVVE